MFTREYKGFYINGYCDKPDCTVVFESGGVLIKVKSYRAAQLAITKFLGKENPNA